MAYGAAWVAETSQTILGTRTKEMQSSGGVRVQVEFSGPHNDHDVPHLFKSEDQRQGGDYEMGKFQDKV